MSLPAAAKGAANNFIKHVGRTAKSPAPQVPAFLNSKFEAHPKPINCTTYHITRDIAADPNHPLHIRTQRRLQAFDPSILHWNVHTPLALSKKATVRTWAARRVKVAFREVLKEQGWDQAGKAIDPGKRALSGALCMYVDKNQELLKANWEQVKTECARILTSVVGKQANVKVSTGSRRDARPHAKRSVERRKLDGAAEAGWSGGSWMERRAGESAREGN